MTNDPITQEVPVVVAEPTATGPLHTGSGWTSPDSTGLHGVVRTVPAELSRHWKRSSLGQARSVQQHAPRSIGSLLITSFRLETFDAHRGRQPGHPVRLRGQGSVGFSGEGDWVEIKGLRLGGVVRGWAGVNHSTGARYRYPTRRPILLLAIVGLLFAGVSLARDAAGAGDNGLAGGPEPTLGPTPTGPPATSGSEDGATGDQGTGSETEATETTLYSPGDPEAPAVAEHRASVIGARADEIMQQARNQERPWSDVVAEHIGTVADIEDLKPELRAGFLDEYEPTRRAMQACLSQPGTTWRFCAEDLVGAVPNGPDHLRIEAFMGLSVLETDAGREVARCLAEEWDRIAPTLWEGCTAYGVAAYYFTIPTDPETGLRIDPTTGRPVDPATEADHRFRDCRRAYNSYAATYEADRRFVDCVNQ